jgi:CO/xanthine dehydrogenase Mo-binding subunit
LSISAFFALKGARSSPTRPGAATPCDRRLARHLRHRHGDRRGQQEDRRRNARPRRDDLGCRCRWCDLGAKKAQTGGPITAAASVNAGGMAPGFSTQFCDVEVDPETGKVTILRFVAAQDVGCAIHPSYVEGQIQGGVAQASAGRSTRSTSTTRTGGSIMPASSIIGSRSPPTCR